MEKRNVGQRSLEGPNSSESEDLDGRHALDHAFFRTYKIPEKNKLNYNISIFQY
jgi:hypothetical protein